MIKRVLLALVLLGLIAAGFLAYKVKTFEASRPSNQHEEHIVQVPKGSSVQGIARLLSDKGLITDARLFGWYVRAQKAGPKIKAGEFRFFTDMTPAQVLEVLEKGEEVRYRLTFPEGFNIKDMAAVVATLNFLDSQKFVALARDPATAKSLGIDAPSLEGFLFPSTYELTRSQDEKVLIAAMVRQFKSHWTPEYEARAHQLGLSQLEVVTLASIVEKETGQPDERPMVASVYHNRLKKHMKLESDPTIIYGLENYDGNIHRADIHRPHPWNTYVITGLPPTPIANPGEGALHAALYPAQSDFIYFVAKGDHTHTFSVTYAEHAAKVMEYQVRRKGMAAPAQQ